MNSTTEEGFRLIDDLADFGSPVMLFSGGEPLVRPDLTKLIEHAVGRGMRAVISTNGTLITPDKAMELKDLGLSYVGISLDGLAEVNDRFRGVPGAFDQAVAGIRNCQEVGLKVGLRFTINKRNAVEVPAIFDLLEKLGCAQDLFLSSGLFRPWVRAHGRGFGPPGNQGCCGPDHRPDQGSA